MNLFQKLLLKKVVKKYSEDLQMNDKVAVYDKGNFIIGELYREGKLHGRKKQDKTDQINRIFDIAKSDTVIVHMSEKGICLYNGEMKLLSIL